MSAALAACGGGGSETGGSTAAAAATDASAAAVTTDVKRLDAGWTTIAGEGQAFRVSGTQTVRYGSGEAWVVQTVGGSGFCSNDAFGRDPLFGTVKVCQTAAAGESDASGWTTLAAEGGSFSVDGVQAVRYGAGANWVAKVVSGRSPCSNDFFGSDPLFGTVKSCQVASAAAGAPSPAPAPAPAPAPEAAPASAPAPAPGAATAQICTPAIAAADTSRAAATVGDGTPGSCTEGALRAALAQHEVVTFHCGSAPVTIPIRAVIDLPTNRNTVIDGGNRVTLDGGGATRILSLWQDNYRTNRNGLTLQHIALKNARAPGGGYVAQNPANPNCAYGYASGGGAAIQVRDARLHVVDVEFRDNAAATPGPDIGGGAIYALGSLDVTIAGSRFYGNSGANSGAVGMLQSTLRVYNSVFEGNSANGVGQNYRGASVDSCPGVGHAGQGGAGGNAGAVGIDGADDTDVVVCGSRFVGNRANELGGALIRTANGSPRRLTIERSQFVRNSARQAGALFAVNAAPLEILASTFAGNQATVFGALQLAASRFEIVNSTFSGNVSARALAGALYAQGNLGGSVVRNATFADNRADGGPGYFGAAVFGDMNFPVVNSVFSNNTSNDPWNPMQCGFSPLPGGNDVQWPMYRLAGGQPDAPCVAGIAFADPLLAGLADNGGPTPTHAPAGHSPLRGAGRDCPATDQRGNPRNPGACTIGAVE